MDSTIVQEQWKPVVGHEMIYAVSNLGNVTTRYVFGSSVRRLGVSRPMTLHKCSNGYLTVDLHKGGRAKKRTVHSLVAEAFIGKPNDGGMWQVNHINGNKHDNRVENLEYVTPSQNQLHATRTGLRKPSCGEINGHAILTESSVADLRAIPLAERNSVRVAARFGVSPRAVRDVWNKLTWKHVA